MPIPAMLGFGLGTIGVAASLWLAYLALTTDAVPLLGSVRASLIAIAVVGIAACAVGGIGQAPVIGWGHPITIVGVVLGITALAMAAAGLFGWDGVVRPLASLVPDGTTLALTTERLAVVGLAAVIVVKWLVGIVLAVIATSQVAP